MRRITVDHDRNAPRVFLYSGHDRAIMPLLLSLGVIDSERAGDEGEWPPYSSHIRLELLQKDEVYDDEEFAVRVVYNGRVVAPGRDGRNATAGMAGLSSFEKHLQALTDAYDGDLAAACTSSTKSHQNPFQDAR